MPSDTNGAIGEKGLGLPIKSKNRGVAEGLVGARGFEPPTTRSRREFVWSQRQLTEQNSTDSRVSPSLRYPQQQDSTERTGTKRTQHSELEPPVVCGVSPARFRISPCGCLADRPRFLSAVSLPRE